MSHRGLSVDEKRKRILQIFHESGSFYQLKEIEKMGPKRGVVAQSVKEILQGLVDDGLVTTDKIATSNYFWSFPSAAKQAKNNKHEELTRALEKETARQTLLDKTIQESQVGREESDDRSQLLAELKEQEETNKALHAELEKYAANDPVLFEQKKKDMVYFKEAVNRWTENIWSIQSYCVNNLNVDRTMFEQSFNIEQDLDTIP